jgi:hypothetical protein
MRDRRLLENGRGKVDECDLLAGLSTLGRVTSRVDYAAEKYALLSCEPGGMGKCFAPPMPLSPISLTLVRGLAELFPLRSSLASLPLALLLLEDGAFHHIGTRLSLSRL